jgi:hypothetical protein
MAVLSPDDCKLIFDTLNTKISFQGYETMKQWLLVMDKLNEGLTSGLETSTPAQSGKDSIVSDTKVEE